MNIEIHIDFRMRTRICGRWLYHLPGWDVYEVHQYSEKTCEWVWGVRFLTFKIWPIVISIDWRLKNG